MSIHTYLCNFLYWTQCAVNCIHFIAFPDTYEKHENLMGRNVLSKVSTLGANSFYDGLFQDMTDKTWSYSLVIRFIIIDIDTHCSLEFKLADNSRDLAPARNASTIQCGMRTWCSFWHESSFVWRLILLWQILWILSHFRLWYESKVAQLLYASRVELHLCPSRSPNCFVNKNGKISIKKK